MARFREIIIILTECSIPNGVCAITAEYGNLTDIERTMCLLYANNGCIKLCSPSGKYALGMSLVPKHPCLIAVSDDVSHIQDYQKTDHTVSCFIRSQNWKTWAKNRIGSPEQHGLWERLYDMWIVL